VSHKPTAEEVAVIAAAERFGWRLLEWEDRKGNPCKGWKSPDGKQCQMLPDSIRMQGMSDLITAPLRPRESSGSHPQLPSK
jgi:hypothetical protein